MDVRAPTQLVGRSRELAELLDALSTATAERSLLVEIIGEPGIGKTALLKKFKAAAQAQEFVCLSASGFRLEADHPYGALTTMLHPVIAEGDELLESDPVDLALLESALPGMRGGGDADSTSPYPTTIGQIEFLHILRITLTHITRNSSGLVIILDNVELIDDLTIAALCYVSRRGIGAPFLIVTAAKLQSPDSALRTASGRALAINLRSLTREEMSDLLGDLNATERDQILDVADGNPFYAAELAAQLRRGSAHPPSSPITTEAALPTSVADAILDEVSALPESAAELLRAASVLGDGFPARIAFRLAQLDGTSGFAALDDLVTALLIRESRHASFMFRHPLVATVIYASLPPGTRIELHARAAELLEQGGADPVAIARHIIASAEVGDEKAIDDITLAAMSCRGVAPRTAVEMTSAALALIPDRGPLASKRPFLQTIEADGLIRSGRFAEAEDTVKRALANLTPDDTVALAWLTVTLLRVQRWQGDGASAIETVSRALEAIPDGHSFERAMLEGAMAVECGRAHDTEAMRRHAESSMAWSLDSGQPFMTLVSFVIIALTESIAGDPHAAISATASAEELVANLTNEQVQLGVDAVAILASIEDWLGRSEDALRCAFRGRTAAIESGNQMAEYWFTLAAAVALTSLARLESAAETAESAEHIARACHNTGLISVSLALEANVAAKQGDFVRARALTQDCLTHRELVQDSNSRMTSIGLLLPALVALERYDDAVTLVREAAETGEVLEIPKSQRAHVYEQLAIAELGRRELEVAENWTRLAAEIASEIDMDLAQCAASRAAARIAMEQGSLAAAIAAASRAVELSGSTGRPLEVANSHLLAGKILVRARRPDEAIQHLESAAEVFNEVGARASAGQTRQLLRELGVTTSGLRSRRGTTGLDSLSGREREIAELVARDLSNPQIAEQMYLSVRTVESHLRRIFLKLQVSSRGDVAAEVRRHQIVTS